MDDILIIEADPQICGLATDHLQKIGYGVAAVDSYAAARELLGKQNFAMVLGACELTDGSLREWLDEGPFHPLVIALSEKDKWDEAGACLESGAFDYLLKPISRGQLNLAIRRAEHALRWRRFGQFTNRQSRFDGLPVLLGKSEAVEELRQTLRKTAPTRATVLIQGDYGAGQGEVAMAIASHVDENIVRLDCAALPEAETEAALFGGPKNGEPSCGAIELAHGGTLILENASLLSWTAQAALLAFLKTGEFATGKIARQVDVRIIASVQENLLEKVRQGEFREDLFYALNIVPIHLPALHERRQDIPFLAEFFRQQQARKTGGQVLAIAPRSLGALQEYAWPGNIAELRMVVERAVVLCGEGVIEPRHLRLSNAPVASETAETVLESIADLERRHILNVLQKCDGNRMRTAEILGISIRTLRNKLKEYRSTEPAEQEAAAAVA